MTLITHLKLCKSAENLTARCWETPVHRCFSPPPLPPWPFPPTPARLAPPLAELLTVLVLEGGDDSAPPASAVRWSSQASSEALKGAACNGCKQLRQAPPRCWRKLDYHNACISSRVRQQDPAGGQACCSACHQATVSAAADHKDAAIACVLLAGRCLLQPQSASHCAEQQEEYTAQPCRPARQASLGGTAMQASNNIR